MTIKILITGGTFDKEYRELTGELFFRNTHVPNVLELGRAKIDVKIRTLMLVDSLEMTDNHRKIILENNNYTWYRYDGRNCEIFRPEYRE